MSSIQEKRESCSGLKERESLSMLRPKNKRPKPIRAWPMFLLRLRFVSVRKNPAPKIGIAKAAILKLKPKIETIQAVIVVPMLAPKITPTDCCKVKRPALTKVTTITVVAPDDWITIVMIRPVKRPLKRFPVITESARCKRSPALFWTPSLINFIPYKRKASEPINCKRPVTKFMLFIIAQIGMEFKARRFAGAAFGKPRQLKKERGFDKMPYHEKNNFDLLGAFFARAFFLQKTRGS